jgi:hypothetical protein
MTGTPTLMTRFSWANAQSESKPKQSNEPQAKRCMVTSPMMKTIVMDQQRQVRACVRGMR